MRTELAVAVLAAATAAGAGAAEAPVFWTSTEVEWTDVAEPEGAKQALLWGDPKTGDHGTLNRWKFNSKAPAVARSQDVHIVVLAGTFTIDREGSEQKQFGPGAFVSIPRGMKYQAGCEAAGECIFMVHQPGPADAPSAVSAAAQAPAPEAELRAEIVRMRESVARAEALLARLEKQAPAPAAPSPSPSVAVAAATPPAPPSVRRAPALNTPPKLPASDAENFKKTPPRIDALLQTRYDHFGDTTRNNTFFLRKAEIGLKGHIARNVDFSIEVDLVRTQANDPYRRTYVRFTHLKRLHLKVGMEKAPLGLEELTANGQIPFAERSEVSDRFSAAEELGVFGESTWDHWMFQASVTNGGRRLYRDDNRRKAFTARAVWAPAPKFSLGAATMQGETGAQLQDRDRYNVEAKYGANNIQGAQGEFYRAKDGDVWSSAFYVQAYWAFPVKKAWLTHLMPTARYEHVGRSDGSRTNELRLLTLGGGLLFNENRSKLLFNWLKDVRSDSPRKHELRAQYTVEF
jgi:quercetin dioxygenase-like cupin family protein